MGGQRQCRYCRLLTAISYLPMQQSLLVVLILKERVDAMQWATFLLCILHIAVKLGGSAFSSVAGVNDCAQQSA